MKPPNEVTVGDWTISAVPEQSTSGLAEAPDLGIGQAQARDAALDAAEAAVTNIHQIAPDGAVEARATAEMGVKLDAGMTVKGSCRLCHGWGELDDGSKCGACGGTGNRPGPMA